MSTAVFSLRMPTEIPVTLPASILAKPHIWVGTQRTHRSHLCQSLPGGLHSLETQPRDMDAGN